jgi:peptidylprolyl isomerase
VKAGRVVDRVSTPTLFLRRGYTVLHMLKATALPAIVILFVVLFWVFMSDWRGNQASEEAESQAAAIVNALYSTSTIASENFALSGQVGTAVPVAAGITAGGEQTLAKNNEKKYMKATFSTNKGDITIEFNTAAPNTVENFTKLAKDGFYNGTKFHRIIENFMIQGGDPLTKDDSKQAMWGTGGPGYTFADEIHAQNNNVIGTISMANAGPNTNGSQFFINVANNNFLDTKHTVFGRVIAGMDVVEAIVSVPTNPQDRPLSPVVINSISLE